MTNAPFPSVEDLRDVDAVNHALELMDEYDSGYEEVRPIVEYRTRDNARTPMQWSGDEHAGFTDGEPWIDVNPNYEEINVECERADSDSVLSYYRELIELRSETPTLIYGAFEDLLPDHEQVYAYERVHEDERIVVVLNTDGSDATVELPETDVADQLLANYDDPPTRLDGATFRPYESAVYRV
jgi:oligo-1,6-glucosidase/alpha-glucosidase